MMMMMMMAMAMAIVAAVEQAGRKDSSPRSLRMAPHVPE
jgi:hypothetical protein